MRQILDEVTPRDLREGFLSIFHEVQRGKLLESYTFLDSYLCLVDGTEIFNAAALSSFCMVLGKVV